MTRGVPLPPETIPVPDANAVFSGAADLRTIGEAICRVTNLTSLAVVVTVQTALGDDPTFTRPNDSGDGFVGAAGVGGISVTGFVSPAYSTVTLPAGATTFARVSGAWSYARVKVAPTGAPAAGGTIVVAWGYKHRGD